MLTIEGVRKGRGIVSVFVELHSHLGSIVPRHLELTSVRRDVIEVYERDEDHIYIFVCYLTQMNQAAAFPLFTAWKAGLRRLEQQAST